MADTRDADADEAYENDFSLGDNWVPTRFLLLELMGTYFYTLISAGIVISSGIFTYQFTTNEMNPSRHIAIALANAFAFAAMLFVAQSFQDNAARRTNDRLGGKLGQFSNFSVGHFNPAITFAVALVEASKGSGAGKARRRMQISPVAAVMYVAAQIIGSCIAAFTIWFAFPFARHSTMGASLPTFGMGATKWHALFMEMVLTFFLVLLSLVTGIYGERDAEELDDQFTPTIKARGGSPRMAGGWIKYGAPLGILLALFACTIVGSPVSGVSMNPARSLGPAIVSNYWIDHWVYWVGPFGGAAAAALVYTVAKP